MNRAAILSLALLAGSGVHLQGQELWNQSFKLSLGTASGADRAGLGQNKLYGGGIAGVYSFTRNHALVLEGGYRVLPTASHTDLFDSDLNIPDNDLVPRTLEQKTTGYFGGIAYRYCFAAGLLEGLYLQGGLRSYSVRTDQVEVLPGKDGGDVRTTLKGGRIFSTKPVITAGFCFTENLSLELSLGGFRAANVDGGGKSLTSLEMALDIRF